MIELLLFVFVGIPLILFIGFGVLILFGCLLDAVLYPFFKIAELFGYKLPNETH